MTTKKRSSKPKLHSRTQPKPWPRGRDQPHVRLGDRVRHDHGPLDFVRSKSWFRSRRAA